MSNKEPIPVWNLSDINEKRRLMEQIRKLDGLYEVSIKKRRKTRTLDQNKYYFVAVVAPFAEWLRESQGDNAIDSDQAHEMLKWKILGPKEVVSKVTGEVEMMPPRSRTLSTMEFWDYVEDASAWLAEFCEIIVLPPELFGEQVPKSTLRKQLEDSIELLERRKQSERFTRKTGGRG